MAMCQTGQFVAGQLVADNSLQTIRRADDWSHGQLVADDLSDRKFVARTVRRVCKRTRN